MAERKYCEKHGIYDSRGFCPYCKIEELDTALREAIDWNWLQHYQAVEDGDCDSMIPQEIVDMCGDALGIEINE